MDIWQASSQAPEQPLRIATAAAYLGFIAVNVASSVGWLGATNAEVSAKFTVPLTPAGWAFGIWGLIFALEGWGVVYQLVGSGYDADGFKARFANATNINWIVAWLACIGWQFAFVQQTPGGMWLSFVLILTAFLAMGRALVQLYSVKDRFGPAHSLSLYAAFFLGTTVNTAWLSVAASVQLLIALQMGVASLEAASIMLATAVTCLGAYALFREHDTAYGLALVWAFVAVYEKTESVAVRNTALGAIVLLAVLSIASVLRRPGQEPHYEPVGAREPLRPSQDEA
ncbi:hypothetical protein CHLNCDRAFT_137452 [Chlorella variabilis]|uniref:Tryptophan-rich sensory protein n=1 Tax=Chlorella variabilis TaxID=554065 RepID=E1ZMG8_CHLVA|nr:hypothetical protein CHLNCDRAFT_137452 [Chlorella variabilis]EFN53001.1 hypothetical protein CHLNCDRAFT_137452 [Chlorella variabilis]|eukprot:XP_005845103.1 hypothetical protein CHLNCDRAFT_137452 [Chlorella variabilis]